MTKEEIKQLRESLNLNQEQFGKSLNPFYSRQHISAVERGKKPVGHKLIRAIKMLKGE
jgi:DNA-binding transcriptional regulator YiaG